MVCYLNEKGSLMNKKPKTIRGIDLEKADLHVHSNISDGVLSIPEVLKKIKDRGKEIMAITDHDGVSGVSEAIALAEKMDDFTVIPGIEFSAEGPRGENLHILGYFIEIENPTLKQTIEDVRRWRRERNLKLYDALTKMGLPITEDDFSGIPNEGYVGKPLIARKLVEKGLLKKYEDAFQPGKYFESEEIRSIEKRKASAEIIIEVIHKAGGVSVLAHPMKIKGIVRECNEDNEGNKKDENFWKSLKVLVEQLKEYGLGGLECYYPTHTKEEEETLIGLANELDLFVTKGSDFHG